jgi:nucleotide-binding universal stress UspA family protein
MWAKDYATTVGATLRVTTAWDWPVVDGVPVTFGSHDPAKAAAVATLASLARCEIPVDAISLDVRRGRAARVLLDAATEADLLVVGSHGTGTLSRLMLGSVSNACVHHSSCPVVVTRPRPANVGSNGVVVGFDDSTGGRTALRWGIEYAARTDQQLIVVMVLQPMPPPMPFRGAPMTTYPHVTDEVDLLREWVTDAVAKEQADCGQMLASAPRIRVLEGNAAAVLTQQSRTAALTVVGNRGTGGFRRLLLGSVSTALVNHAESPVAVIRTLATDRQGGGQ